MLLTCSQINIYECFTRRCTVTDGENDASDVRNELTRNYIYCVEPTVRSIC